ncbi:thiopeptide-type bacteriocin biosynthesis domain-containing protein [Hymenobacter daecheongensis DSM 21074]|uniref:Thiopeptide-type bacteriocin biosynthesis domain-containing protein n=2 Tax=Hymenobacter daecheongensis TaxID=496053 RepID=A0A1M6IY62_9BACT|nr:thiopeptide-type bacteriocin biosynthesis domain-containing protein [Hymenobacter daecheongensis DSM 21074]
MIQHYGFFLLRRPALPLQRLQQLRQSLLTQPLGKLMRDWYTDPAARQAIYVASAGLHERLSRWLAGEVIPEEARLLDTLHKYAIRMSSRCTPYGLLAGCALGRVGAVSQLGAARLPALRSHTRLDAEYLQALHEWLLLQPDVRGQVLLYPNTSLYAVGDSLRYVEQQRDALTRRYFISAVEADEFLRGVLAQAAAGTTLPALVRHLGEQGIEPEEAEAYLDQLLADGVLRSALEPTVIGPDYLPALLGQLAVLPGAEALVAELSALHELLTTHPDADFVGKTVESWLAARQIAAPATGPLRVDAYYPEAAPQLSETLLQQLQQQLQRLFVLNQPSTQPDLDDFKRRFHTRYEDEEVPLALALDQEHGVGYGSSSALGIGYAPMIDDLSLPATEAAPPRSAADWWQALVLQKYSQALREAQAEIELTDADLAYIGQQRPAPAPLPDSFYVFGNLLAAPEPADYRFNLLACQGPSAIQLLGRFCAGDAQLAAAVAGCVRRTEEHHSEVVFAEIVHFPESRAGNIMTRPTLYRYEIPYLGRASVPAERQLPLADLYVSVRNGELLLRSRRLNKRVIPRLSNAHNFHQGVPIYRFLCDLQQQTSHLNVQWNWSVLAEQAYLPRVRYRSIILSRATWLLRSAELEPDNLMRLATMLTRRGVPEQFVLAVGDNELSLSLHVPDSLRLLAQELRKSATVRLYEVLQTAESCAGPGRPAFANELVLPFYNPAAPAIAGLRADTPELPPRRFSIGSEWLYLKVYTGEKTSDGLLAHTLYPVIQRLLDCRVVEHFFFVRYRDNDPHLRLRFRGNSHLEFYHIVIQALERCLREPVRTGSVHRIQTDTYQRELERYGHQQIGQCETLFHCDSLSTLRFLSRTGAVFAEPDRFCLAIAKIDRLLALLALPYAERHALLHQLQESFFAEFRGDANLRRQLNDKHRQYRPLLEQALRLAAQPAPPEEAALEEQQRAALLVLQQTSPTPAHLRGLLASLIHMIVNRLFPSKQRAYELMLYHCLARQYQSLQARSHAAEKAAALEE